MNPITFNIILLFFNSNLRIKIKQHLKLFNSYKIKCLNKTVRIKIKNVFLIFNWKNLFIFLNSFKRLEEQEKIIC